MTHLTPAERQSLQMMQALRDTPFSLADVVIKNWRAYLVLLGMFAFVEAILGVGVYFGLGGMIPLGCVVGGVLLGVLLRDVSQMNAAANAWPVTCDVIDWQKVQQLLDDDGRPTPFRLDEPAPNEEPQERV